MLKRLKSIVIGCVYVLLGCIGLWLCMATSVEEELLDRQVERMPDYDYLREIRDLQASGRLGEAEHLADWVLSGSSITNKDAVAALRDEINRKRTSLWGRSKRAVKGFVVGDGTSIEELGGALVSDFLLWGDIRDLAKQGYNKVTGKETDPVVAALAAVGVCTSVATFFAGGATAAEMVATPATAGASSAGVPATAAATSAAAVADASLRFMKILRKTGHLTKRFSRFLVDACKRSSKAKSLDKGLGETFVGIKNITQSVGAACAATIMKHVDDVDSLKTVSKMAKQTAEPTMIIVRAHGVDGIKTLGKLADAKDGAVILEKTARKGAPGIKKLLTYTKYGARVGKSFRKGNIQKFTTKLAATVGRIPMSIISSFLLFAGLWKMRKARGIRMGQRAIDETIKVENESMQ